MTPTCCSEELEQDARDDEHGDDLGEREEAEECADEAEGDERAVGNSVAWVDGGEKAEVVAVAGGGVGDARVAEEQREDTGEGGPDDEGGDQVAGPAAEGGAGDVGDELTGGAEGGGLGGVGGGARAATAARRGS